MADDVTAAVVGVIANLPTSFALSTLFTRTDRSAWGPVHLEVLVLSVLE